MKRLGGREGEEEEPEGNSVQFGVSCLPVTSLTLVHSANSYYMLVQLEFCSGSLRRMQMTE